MNYPKISAFRLENGLWAGWSNATGWPSLKSLSEAVERTQREPEFPHIIIDADNCKAWVSNMEHADRAIKSAKVNFNVDIPLKNVFVGFPEPESTNGVPYSEIISISDRQACFPLPDGNSFELHLSDLDSPDNYIITTAGSLGQFLCKQIEGKDYFKAVEHVHYVTMPADQWADEAIKQCQGVIDRCDLDIENGCTMGFVGALRMKAEKQIERLEQYKHIYGN